MAANILDIGLTAIRDALKTLFTHVGVSQDATAFATNQTAIDPAGDVAANRLIKAGTDVDVDFKTFDSTMSITGATEMTGKNIFTIAVLVGALRTNIVNRIVRTLAIGVESGDVYTGVGVRVQLSDVS